MATTIVTKSGSGAPTASDLVAGELAVDLTNKRLYTEDSGGTVLELGTNPASDVTFGDNTKAVFGAGSDLQIYHDGSNSYIKDDGTGNLFIQGTSLQLENAAGENFVNCVSDGTVAIYFNNNKKFETTSTGIDVAGTALAHEIEIGDGSAGGTSEILFSDNVSARGKILYDHSSSPETMLLQTTGTTAISIDNSQNISIPNGNLDVTGTVTADGLTSSGDLSVTGVATIGADAGGEANILTIKGRTSDNDAYIKFTSSDGATSYAYAGVSSANTLAFYTNGFTKRLDIGSGGDISFYEDTGTTPKFFWDASAESLGIGATTVNRKLEVAGNNNAGSKANFIRITDTDTSATAANPQGGIEFYTSDTGNENVTASIVNLYAGSGAGSELTFNTAPNGASGVEERLRIDDSGNVDLYQGSNLTWRFAAGSTIRGSMSIDSADNITFSNTSSNTERMRIDASGNVGIGCVPQGNLDIDVAVDTSLGLRSQTGVIVAQHTGAPAVGNRAQIGLGYGNTYTNVSIGAVRTSATAYGTDDFIIATKSGTADTAPTERMRIDSSGNLLVGTTSATGSGASSGKQVIQFNGAAENGIYFDDTRTASGTSVAAIFGRGSTAVGRLDTTLNSVALTSLSDERVKNNIVDAPSASDDIDAIQVRSFDWKSDGSHQKYGMVAQELLEVAPEAVSAPEDPEEMMGVDYSKLVPMMLKEIQSLRARVAQLES